jgi:hypothetical protein
LEVRRNQRRQAASLAHQPRNQHKQVDYSVDLNPAVACSEAPIHSPPSQEACSGEELHSRHSQEVYLGIDHHCLVTLHPKHQEPLPLNSRSTLLGYHGQCEKLPRHTENYSLINSVQVYHSVGGQSVPKWQAALERLVATTARNMASLVTQCTLMGVLAPLPG